MKIPSDKLDPQAVKQANEQLWENHPELHGRSLTMDPKDALYRQEWIQYYLEALPQLPLPPPPKVEPVPVESSLPPIVADSPKQTCGLGPNMTHEQKMEEAIKRAPLSDQVREEIGDPKTLVATMVIVGGILIVTGSGTLAALLLIGAALSVWQIGEGINSLLNFYQKTRCDTAKTPEDLEAAGRDFADGIAKMGVGGLNLLLALLGARGRTVTGKKIFGDRSPYPGRGSIPPGAKKKLYLPNEDMIVGSRKAMRDIPRGHNHPEGIWDQNILRENPRLKQKLDDFQSGRCGNSVKEIDTSGKSPEQLHEELIQKGFQHQREPLKAGKDERGRPLYKKRDGTRTPDPNDPEVVPHDIYKHPDGGIVRVKPEGDPGPGFRPEPHVSKSVLYDPRAGTSFDNEAFKVTNDGYAVPKSPNREAGMKQAPIGSRSRYENQGYIDTVMSRAHTDLPE